MKKSEETVNTSSDIKHLKWDFCPYNFECPNNPVVAKFSSVQGKDE